MRHLVCFCACSPHPAAGPATLAIARFLARNSPVIPGGPSGLSFLARQRFLAAYRRSLALRRVKGQVHCVAKVALRKRRHYQAKFEVGALAGL
jgi:hypothetical protein